tara:strand:- start:24 stop:377 length:354 start_codon:yes stop_codon:yes gene_type:complete
MNKHKMVAYAPFGLEPDAIDVLITFTFLPGARATRIDPADPAEVEFVSATATLHTLDTGMQAMLDDWAREYLGDAGYSDACASAEDDNTGAREDAADFRRRQARDDALTERLTERSK